MRLCIVMHPLRSSSRIAIENHTLWQRLVALVRTQLYMVTEAVNAWVATTSAFLVVGL